MSSITDRFWRGANKAAVWVYRRTGGKVGGRAKGGSRVLLLTTPGRKSGRAHTVPVAYVVREGSYYLAATAGGMPSAGCGRDEVSLPQPATVLPAEPLGTRSGEPTCEVCRRAGYQRTATAL